MDFNKDNCLTVKQLKETINKLDDSYDNHLVILSGDSEGNDYRVIDSNNFLSTNSKFIPENSWLGDVRVKYLTDELIEAGYNEEDLCQEDDSYDCIVLYPMN